MPAKLSTHVLDIAQGCPAQGVQIELWSLAGDTRELLKSVRSNADGRTDQPLLAAEEMRAGRYELVFHVGDYFAGKAASGAESGFPLKRGLTKMTVNATANNAMSNIRTLLSSENLNLMSPFWSLP